MKLIASQICRWQTIVLFGAALLVRLVLAPFPGFWGDTNLLVQYARVAEQKGLLGVNKIDISVLYPAGYLYHSYAVGYILKNKLRDANTYDVDGLTPNGVSVVERIGVRAIPITYDLLIAAILLVALSNCVSPRAGQWGAAIYLFNPGVIVSSAIWNYDSVPSFYQLAAVVLAGLALRNGRGVYWLLAWAAAGLAFTMKAQAGMLVPVLAVMTLCTRRLKLVLMAPVVFFAVVALVFSPFLLGHEAIYIKRAYLDSFDAYPFTHMGAYNLWALWFQKPVSNRLAGLSLETIGRGLFLASMMWLSWCIWRQKAADGTDALRRAAVVFTYAFAAPFVLLTRMHERYLAPTVAVVVLAGLLDSRLRGAMWGISVGFAVNMMAILTQNIWQTDDAELIQATHLSYCVVRFFCCLLIVGVFIWLTCQLPKLLKPFGSAVDSLGASVPSSRAMASAAV
jgi:dolichyl-phosphate-mannose-protein mannosyltransferase